MKQEIPEIIIGRLPLYLRVLTRLQKQGREFASSKELGKLLHISPAQIRKDLSQFGELGKRGTGYQIDFLIKTLSDILNINNTWDLAIIGAGDIGHALARYGGFVNRGFRVKMIFDSNPEKIGTQICDIPIQDSKNMKAALQESNIKIAMLATPAEAAQDVADQLVEAGIKAILNYAPIELSVPPGTRVEHIDPAIHLQKLSYYLDK
jgi:redox-sensing transcriptional repressor